MVWRSENCKGAVLTFYHEEGRDQTQMSGLTASLLTQSSHRPEVVSATLELMDSARLTGKPAPALGLSHTTDSALYRDAADLTWHGRYLTH